VVEDKNLERLIREDLDMDINNPAGNEDESKCMCYTHNGIRLIKAMLCGSTFCRAYLNKDIWNVRGSAKDDIYGDKE
jgi:hypothetical protein